MATTGEYVIGKFGGQSALAALLGKGRSTVAHWAKTGTIPAQWHGTLLALARERGFDVQPRDLVEPVTEVADSGNLVNEVQYAGILVVAGVELPVYVLSNGRRVISRTGATSVLIGPQGGGNLQSYLDVQAVRPYVPEDLMDRMVEFRLPNVTNKTVLGMDAETFLDVCRAYVQARDDGALKTASQTKIAKRAGTFLAACAKVGLLALIDEATGYQFHRAEDELRFKLKIYLEDEMRKWESTFPPELWHEFGRLTGTQMLTSQRPKYWGKLVMELVYDYLDPDVADWLRVHNPEPRHGRNHHQWLTSQYGLRKLTEHLWMLIGLASACNTIGELRARMAERYGRVQVQQTLFVLPPIGTSRSLPSASKGSPGVQPPAIKPEIVQFEFGQAMNR